MFGKSTWIAIGAALCMAQAHEGHDAEVTKASAQPMVGISTVFRHPNGSDAGVQTKYVPAPKSEVTGGAAKSAAEASAQPMVGISTVFRHPNGSDAGVQTKYVPAPKSEVTGEAAKSAAEPATAGDVTFGTSTVMRDANGNIIGSESSYGTVRPAKGATA
jgi:hypothetical protein